MSFYPCKVAQFDELKLALSSGAELTMRQSSFGSKAICCDWKYSLPLAK
ncbi:MAG: hypothetical protein HRT88_22480 [Lentisphaeraceae bacterium]|nr:hypothetical protein [Lentisphaeraceae bacterium]